MKHAIGFVCFCIAALSLCLVAPTPSWAQEAPADAPVAAGAEPASAAPQILLLKMNWVLRDMVRCIEELRRVKKPWQKRELVEEVEDNLFREVEFPLLYKQAEMADLSDLGNVGITPDVSNSSWGSPLAPKYAEAYALMGIAKGFEGFSTAATDNFEKAKKIYPDVMSLSIQLDRFEEPKTLTTWIADNKGSWGSTQALRVTFYGKKVNQGVVDGLNEENVVFESERKGIDYFLYVAKKDFLKGVRRYIVTDDVLKKNRPNKFAIYLPPGKYRLKTDVSSQYDIEIEIVPNAAENNFILESLENGITCYPIPDLEAFRAEMKALREAEKEGQELGELPEEKAEEDNTQTGGADEKD